MVDASLNWASIIGIILSVSSVIFLIFKKSRNGSIHASTNLLTIVTFVAGLLLFFQGWRLDPILQLSIAIIIFGTFLEAIPLIYSDSQKKNKKEIAVTKEVSIVEPIKKGDKE